MASELPFETEIDKADAEPSFLVDVDGFEGPLDLLLELARRQKVDLAKISVLALAEQYLEFIEEARKVRLELAADYLVMGLGLLISSRACCCLIRSSRAKSLPLPISRPPWLRVCAGWRRSARLLKSSSIARVWDAMFSSMARRRGSKFSNTPCGRTIFTT